MSCHDLSLEFKERRLVSALTFFARGEVWYVVSPLRRPGYLVCQLLGILLSQSLFPYRNARITEACYYLQLLCGFWRFELSPHTWGTSTFTHWTTFPTSEIQFGGCMGFCGLHSTVVPQVDHNILHKCTEAQLSPDCECLGTSVVPVCLLMRGVILPSQDNWWS